MDHHLKCLENIEKKFHKAKTVLYTKLSVPEKQVFEDFFNKKISKSRKSFEKKHNEKLKHLVASVYLYESDSDSTQTQSQNDDEALLHEDIDDPLSDISATLEETPPATDNNADNDSIETTDNNADNDSIGNTDEADNDSIDKTDNFENNADNDSIENTDNSEQSQSQSQSKNRRWLP